VRYERIIFAKQKRISAIVAEIARLEKVSKMMLWALADFYLNYKEKQPALL
jgi:hypothetical protein